MTIINLINMVKSQANSLIAREHSFSNTKNKFVKSSLTLKKINNLFRITAKYIQKCSFFGSYYTIFPLFYTLFKFVFYC